VKKTVRKRIKEISVLMGSKSHFAPPLFASGENIPQGRAEWG
jgi:hypothetical protein